MSITHNGKASPDNSYHYDLEASKKAHQQAQVAKPIAATAEMRDLINQLKPGNVTDTAQRMNEVLDRIIKEMQCR